MRRSNEKKKQNQGEVMTKQEAVALFLKRVDVRGLIVEDLLDKVLEAALDKLVADTANPVDNMLKDALYPVIKKELITQLDAFMAKLKE
jgi:hypothetical protein